MLRICSTLGLIGAFFTLSLAGAEELSFWDRAKADFALWDLDKNGELSLAEIDRAIADPKVKAADAATAVAMRRALKSKKAPLAPFTIDKIAPAKIEKTVPMATDKNAPPKSDKNAPPKTASTEVKAKGPDLEALYKSALKKISTNRASLYGPSGPKLESISQGRVGDCFCLAPLGAMTHRDPDQVRSMFQAEKDGTLKVKLGKELIDVPPLTDGELALLASTRGEGNWVQLYEKAMGLHLATKKAKMTTPIGAVGSGGSAGTALALITGQPIERFSMKAFKDPKTEESVRKAKLEELRTRLEHAIKDKRLVCGGTPSKVEVPGVTPNHAYAILNYDRKTDLVTFWNPHGQTFKPKGPTGLKNGYEVKVGKFDAPLTEVITWFNGFSWEMPKKG